MAGRQQPDERKHRRTGSPAGSTSVGSSAESTVQTPATDAPAVSTTRGAVSARRPPTTSAQTRILPRTEPESTQMETQRTPRAERALVTTTAPTALLIRGSNTPPRRYGRVVPRRSGPHSPLAQFLVAMVSVVLLVSTLTLATPLGQGAAAAGSFQSLAGAVPWIPTPTPMPTATPVPVVAYRPPSGANPGQQAVINLITAVFGPNAPSALAIARCESGYDPNAWNGYAIGGSHASGVFQILYPSTWNTTSYAGRSPFDADANVRAAYQIFARDGFSWRQWACRA